MTTPSFQGDKELDRTMKELKRASDLQRRNSILANMVRIMGSKGASEQSIGEVLY